MFGGIPVCFFIGPSIEATNNFTNLSRNADPVLIIDEEDIRLSGRMIDVKQD
jgi:hypothetical protein